MIDLLEEKKRKDLIERLKEERMISEGEWRSLGSMNGKREAYCLEYLQFIEIAKLYEEIRKLKASIHYEIIARGFESKFGGERLQKIRGKCGDDVLNQAEYILGWWDGVVSIWNEVKDQLV